MKPEVKFLIYQITVSSTRKRYVGCTRNLSDRMADHRLVWLKGLKYRVDVLAEDLTESQALRLEAQLIAKYDLTNPSKGYNKRLGGLHLGLCRAVLDARSEKIKRLGILAGPNNGMYGKAHTEQTKQVMSLLATGRSVSWQTRERMSRAHLGQRAWNKGIPRTPEEKEKIRAGTLRVMALQKQASKNASLSVTDSQHTPQPPEKGLKHRLHPINHPTSTSSQSP